MLAPPWLAIEAIKKRRQDEDAVTRKKSKLLEMLETLEDEWQEEVLQDALRPLKPKKSVAESKGSGGGSQTRRSKTITGIGQSNKKTSTNTTTGTG